MHENYVMNTNRQSARSSGVKVFQECRHNWQQFLLALLIRYETTFKLSN